MEAVKTISDPSKTYTPPAGSVIHELDVSLDRRGMPPVVHLDQYDDTLPVLAVGIFHGEQPYKVPTGAAVNVRMRKPDGTHVYNPSLGLSADRTTAYIGVTLQMTAAAGHTVAILEIVASGVVGTAPIEVDITRNPVPADAMESTDEYVRLDELVSAAQRSADAALASQQAAKSSETAAKNSQTAAASSATAASGSATKAKASEDAASTSAANAKASENAAESAQTAAEKSAANAKASETAANNSKTAAASSATAAKASENNAKSSADAAKASQTAAATSATNAATSATNAATSESNASKSAAAAKTSESNADKSKTAAANSASAAATSESNAQDSADAAKASQTAAKTSETNAKSSETAAASSKTAAATSATQAAESKTAAASSASAAATSASNASKSETAAKSSQTAAANSATAASGSATAAAKSATDAAASATSAATQAKTAQSYVEGGTNTRPGEDGDNARYYYEQAKRIAEGLQGALLPMGNIQFSGLANADKTPGNMYNVTDAFTTDATFKEGAGHPYAAGTNVYWTVDGYWDALPGIQVTGVKGHAENTYRLGQVDITPANIGLGNVNNTADSAKNVLSATKLATARQLGVNLARTTASTFDGSANQLEIPVKGVLPVANGGTGATTAEAARTALGALPSQYTTVSSSNKDVLTSSTGTQFFDVRSGVVEGHEGEDLAVMQVNTGVDAFQLGASGSHLIVRQNDNPTTAAWPTTFTQVMNKGDTADAAIKLATARQLGVNLARTAASTFDGSANQLEIPVKGILPVANGGTGATTASAALTALGGVPTTRKVNNKALSGDITLTASDVGAVAKSGDTMTGTLVLSKSTDASGTANNSPALIVGGTATSPHIEIDNNEILSKKNGTEVEILSLNTDGGVVQIGSGGISNLGDLTLNGASRAIKYVSGSRTGSPITFYAGDQKGSGIVIGDGGRTIIGGGEAAQNLRGALGTETTKESAEEMHIAGDGYVYIHTNCQTIANRQTVTINNSGNINAPGGFSGNLTGNAGTATKLATARSLKTNLGSTTAVTFDGSAAQDNIPITGTLAVGHGGTGATTLTSGAALIGNGANAVTTRAITNMTAKGPITGYNTNLMTTNTLAFWNGSYDASGASNLAYLGTVTKGTWNATAIGIAHGGTGATTASAALTALGGVPTTRKVNNKALSGDISLTASDVGALPITGGTISGSLNVGGNVELRTDSEGGNLVIRSPSTIGGYWEIDSVDGNLRFGHVNSTGTSIPVSIHSDGIHGNLLGVASQATALQTQSTTNYNDVQTSGLSFVPYSASVPADRPFHAFSLLNIIGEPGYAYQLAFGYDTANASLKVRNITGGLLGNWNEYHPIEVGSSQPSYVEGKIWIKI